MAYDESLGLRIHTLLEGEPDLEEKKMFGGVGFLLNGNMACGVHKDALIVRVGAEAYQAALDEDHTRMFDMTGRPMTGWVSVDPPGISSEESLQEWVWRGLDFASSLPPK